MTSGTAGLNYGGQKTSNRTENSRTPHDATLKIKLKCVEDSGQQGIRLPVSEMGESVQSVRLIFPAAMIEAPHGCECPVEHECNFNNSLLQKLIN